MSQTTAPRLGRGLASLIPQSVFEADQEQHQSRVRTVPLDEIEPNPEQPRTEFDEQAIASLANSIRQHGLLSPVLARRENGRYILISGERRWRASALAGLSEIPVIVHTTESDAEILELALVENLQRADLNPIEEAAGYQRLIDTFGYTQQGVAKRIGKNRSTVANALRLLKLPSFVLDLLRGRSISAGHARALLPLADKSNELRELLSRITEQQLSVRETEKWASRLAKSNARKTRRCSSLTARYSYATTLLKNHLQTAIRIRPRASGGGQVVIEFSDDEHLDDLLERIRANL